MKKKPGYVRSKNNVNVHKVVALLTSINYMISSSLQKLMFCLFSFTSAGIDTYTMGTVCLLELQPHL